MIPIFDISLLTMNLFLQRVVIPYITIALAPKCSPVSNSSSNHMHLLNSDHQKEWYPYNKYMDYYTIAVWTLNVLGVCFALSQQVGCTIGNLKLKEIKQE